MGHQAGREGCTDGGGERDGDAHMCLRAERRAANVQAMLAACARTWLASGEVVKPCSAAGRGGAGERRGVEDRRRDSTAHIIAQCGWCSQSSDGQGPMRAAGGCVGLFEWPGSAPGGQSTRRGRNPGEALFLYSREVLLGWQDTVCNSKIFSCRLPASAHAMRQARIVHVAAVCFPSPKHHALHAMEQRALECIISGTQRNVFSLKSRVVCTRVWSVSMRERRT